MGQQVQRRIRRFSYLLTRWMGTPYSLIVHTFLFGGIFILPFLGVKLDKILLILTTVVSLEAIYMAIFIQMTVNRNVQNLEDVEEDIEDIQEDVQELEEEIDEDEKAHRALTNMELELKRLQDDLKVLRKTNGHQTPQHLS